MYTDVIMDMLGVQKMRIVINNYYEESGEQELVRRAVSEALDKEQKHYHDEIDASNHGVVAKLQNLR